MEAPFANVCLPEPKFRQLLDIEISTLLRRALQARAAPAYCLLSPQGWRRQAASLHGDRPVISNRVLAVDPDDLGKLILALVEILGAAVDLQVIFLELILKVEVGADFLPTFADKLECR